jgi:GTP cyclohydrolase III
MGSDPLETFLSTGKASKHGNSDGEQRADAIDQREQQRQEEHSQQSHNDVLAVPGHCN